MSKHYTKKFKEVFEEVLRIAEIEGPERGKLAFRDAMLAIGHEERVRNLYRVQDKLSKQAKFFIPNAPQEQYLKSKSKRNIILKCRQVGFTTLNCIRALDYALWESNMRTGVLCHKLQVVKTIFNDITKFCYNWFLRDWGHMYRPEEKSDSSTSLSFATDGLGRPLESSILVLHDFRGKTIHFMHVSEASRLEKDRLVGSLNGVPDNGEITLESTAAGRSGEFYRLWQSWRNNKQTAPYKGFFVPWYKYYPENLDEWEFPKDGILNSKELTLLESYPGKITKNHVFWRRYCIEAKCGGDEESFENEYPTNDLDCFLTGDANVFSSSILKMQDRNTRPPVFIGHLISHGNVLEIHEDAKGCVSIWEEPEPARVYVIGADPSGGVGQDNGAAYVKDTKTGKLVARIWGDLTPDDFAKELYKLAKFYNNAWMCVESNNHGHVVIHVLKELGYRNLYKRSTIDEMTNKPTKKIGFVTTNQSKILITEKLKTASKEGKVIILDADLIAEMSTFVQISSKSGSTVKREASSDAHDDLVMAAALTEEMHSARDWDNNTETGMNEVMELSIDPDTGFIIG
jgi:hypothetical protein